MHNVLHWPESRTGAQTQMRCQIRKYAGRPWCLSTAGYNVKRSVPDVQTLCCHVCSLDASFADCAALLNPKTPILIQKRHPYTGILNSETPGKRVSTSGRCLDHADATDAAGSRHLHGGLEAP